VGSGRDIRQATDQGHSSLPYEVGWLAIRI
jgi:hypothetical protein